LDEHLNFKRHIEKLRGKISPMVYKANLKPIQILQTRALKSVFNKGPLFGTVELYHTVAKCILPVRALYEYQVSCYVFKVMKCMVHSNLTFGRLTHLPRSRARVENQLGSTGARTDYGKRSISFSGPTMFNSLGCNIGLDMVLRLSELENLLRGKLATLDHLVEHFGVVRG
jgi:hypothetical protein